MKFGDFLVERQLLTEGGAALKGTAKLTQVEARHLLPDVVAKVAGALGVDSKKIKAVGSAGRKPNDDDLSGDLDLAVETTPGKAELALPKLAHDGETYRVMRGINVFSFAEKLNGKLIQVDVMPVEDVTYAEWAYRAHEDDLKLGLKGAHRNEVLFAIAKYANRNVLKKGTDGEPIEVERYYLDLGKGLMSGKQSRLNKEGKVVKGWTTTDKHLLTRDPDKVVELLFGKGFNAKRISTFGGALNAVNSDKFQFAALRKQILDQVREGLQKKKLEVPEGLGRDRVTEARSAWEDQKDDPPKLTKDELISKIREKQAESGSYLDDDMETSYQHLIKLSISELEILSKLRVSELIKKGY